MQKPTAYIRETDDAEMIEVSPFVYLNRAVYERIFGR